EDNIEVFSGRKTFVPEKDAEGRKSCGRPRRGIASHGTRSSRYNRRVFEWKIARFGTRIRRLTTFGPGRMLQDARGTKRRARGSGFQKVGHQKRTLASL
ncbi:hypothetical protein KM043_011709, partial [Ampulex compressa]